MESREHGRHCCALACAVVAIALAFAPSRAAAWTRAQVETAAARVDLQASGQAHVTLELGIRVAGGWLSQFELTGLESDVALDPEQPPVVLSEDGRSLTPIVKLRGEGRVLFSFPDKKTAPHRGLHQLRLAYRTTLAFGEPKAQSSVPLSWSLPAWQVDLRQSEITIDAPLGTRFAEDAESDVAVERELSDQGARTILRVHRGRLPRTMVLSAELELPATAGVVLLPDPARANAQGAGLGVAALVLLLSWMKRAATLAAGARRGVRPKPLLSVGTRTRACSMLALAVLAGLCYRARPYLGLCLLVALVTLALDRGFFPATATTRPRSAAARARELFGNPAWMDATTPLGLSLLGSAYALAFQRLALGAAPGLWLEALLLVTPLWLTATRLHSTPSLPADNAAAGATVSAGAGRPALDRAA